MQYYNLNVSEGIFEITEVRRDWLLENEIIEEDPDCPGDYRLRDGPQQKLARVLLDVTGEEKI
jgi:hypothetical protein